LLKTLWPDSFVEEGSLTRNISTLRKILGESPDDQKYILTVPKRGYRFVAQVRPAAATNQAAIGADVSAFSASRGSQGTIQAAKDQQFLLVRPQQPAVVWWERREIDSAFPIQSIAVKPFENISGDNSQDYFAAMLTEALISELARIHKLKVFPGSVMLQCRRSAFRPSGRIASGDARLRIGDAVEQPSANHCEGNPPIDSIGDVVRQL
jgi:hypothetical protein